MKTKVKRLSKRSLAIFLGMIMLVSCIVVGQVTTVSATTYYYRGTNVSGASWASGAAFTAVTGSSKYVYVTKTNDGDFQITSYQTDWNDSSGRYNLTVDTNYGKGGLTSASGYTNNIGDSNTGTHYIIFDTTSGSHKTFALAAAPVIDTVYIRDDANWGKSKIKLYTFSNSTSGTNSPANGQTLGGWSGTNMTSLVVEDLDDNGTTVYKVTGFLHTAGIILNKDGSNDDKTGDMTLISGHLYTTGSCGKDMGAYTEPTPLVDPKTATATVSHEKSGGSRIVSGDGSVQINSGSTSTTTATATVESGSSVTFTAIPDNGNDFAGWYSDEACTTLVDTNTTHTVSSMTSDTTLYAAFNKHYYLVGKFYLADLAPEVTPAYNSTDYAFTQSSSNPAVYEYEGDFMFKYNSTEGSTNLQYVTVGYGGSRAYYTDAGNATSGTAASGISSDKNSNKWTCGTAETAEYPEAEGELNNSYKHVKFTWNAITETLSWTVTDVDTSKYTVLYVHGGDYTNQHLWLQGGDVLTTWPGIPLIGTPYVVIDNVPYNIVLIKNTTIGDNELKYKLSKNGGSEGNEHGGIYKGNTYKIDGSDDSKDPEIFNPTEYSVGISTTDNGHGSAAIVDKSTAPKNATITITTAQDNDYAAVVTATDASSNPIDISRTDATHYTFTMPASNVTVNVEYFENVAHKVNVGTADDELGTVTSNKTTAYPGDEVTITLAPHSNANYRKNSFAVEYNDGSSNVNVHATTVSEGITYKFIMPAYDVSATARFEEYEALADYWYDGYNASHTALSDYTTKQFTEAMFNGHKYAYYKVTRPTGSSDNDNHVFGVKTSTTATPGSGGSYVYWKFDINNNWNNDAKIKFYDSSNNVISDYSDWKDMSFVRQYESKYKVCKAQVPSGAAKVRFTTSAQNVAGNYTSMIDLASPGCYETKETQYTTSGSVTTLALSDMNNCAGYTISDNYTGASVGGSGKYYTWNVDSAYADPTAYGSDINIYNHGSSSPIFAHTGHTHTDYFIIVLYAGNNYGSLWDGAAAADLSSSSTIKIIASKYLPGNRPAEVEIYAKDGAIRNHDGYGPYITRANIGDTAISTTITRGSTTDTISVTDHEYKDTEGNSGATAAYGQDYQTATALAGDVVTITTTVASEYRSTYYVKGFVVNGTTPKTYTYRSDGVYTLEYTITGNERNKKLEVTPVYFLKDDSNTINFSIEGFTSDIQGLESASPKWGDTMYVYPFYESTSRNNNAFGSYPGQPLIFDGGKYYIQIPKSVKGNTVQGVTMSNGYWDHVHRSVMGWSNDNANHRQTYDYDDFYKISNELTPDNIIFDFKYETTKQNRSDTTNYTSVSDLTSTFGTNGNGFEDLVDHYERKIDVFGNVLTTEEANNAPVYVVSKGYQSTNAGDYATLWDVYYPNNGTSTTNVVKAGSLNPSALVLTNADKFEGYNNSTFTSYKSVYQTLNSTATAKKHPVKITFESEILDGNDKAERSDGQWYHTSNNDIIRAYTRIEIQQDDGSYVVDDFASNSNAGTATGVKAYFTNEETNVAGESYYGKTDTGNVYSNNKKNFTFTAEPNGEYEFVEWKRLVKGEYYDITGDAQSPMTSNDVYVARFKKVKSGTLTVTHTLLPITGYEGSGKTYVKLDILATENATTPDYTTDFQENTAQLTGTYLKYNSSKYVQVTLKTVPNGEDVFHEMTCAQSVIDLNNVKFFPSGNATVDSGTATKTFKFQINSDLFNNGEDPVTSSLAYYSNLSKMKYNYEIKYFFNGREFGNGENSQWYVAKGTFTSDEVKQLVKDGEKYKIPSELISDKKPYERDFMRDLNWDFDTAAATLITPESGMSEKTLKLEVREAVTSSSSSRNAVFKLPYYYNPNNNYEVNANIPVPKIEERIGSLDAKYYVTAGYYYTDTDTVNGVTYSAYEVPSGYTGSKDKSFVSAYYGETDVPKYVGDDVPSFVVNTQYGKRFSLDPVYNESDKDSTYVTAAPSVYKYINNEWVQKYFSYWIVKSQASGKEIAKCYSEKFNFSAYENYYIEAIYESDSASNYSDAGNEPQGSTISFLDSSRNQWNENGGGKNTTYDAGDVLFKDFAIAYKYKSVVLNNYTDEDVRVGMAVEMLGALDTEEGSGAKIKSLTHYADKYADTNSASITELEYRLKNGTRSDSTKKISINGIASNVDGDSGYGALSDTSLIDNKNRLKYHYAVYNKARTTDYPYRNYVYRAYSYIMVREKGASNWTNATVSISSEPVYFIFEDIASK